MIVGVLTTCHTQYSWDRSFSFSLFRKMRHTVGCGMSSSLLPLAIGFLVLRMNACLTCSTCSSVTDGLPVLFLLHTHPVSWNCAHHLRKELSDGGCFPNLERKCRWTIVTDRHSWNVNTQNALSLPFAAILVNCAPSGEMHNYCTPHIIKRKLRISWSISATTYSYLKCIVYDKLLKPRQSFLTHYGWVMQICVFNTVKLGTSASSA